MTKLKRREWLGALMSAGLGLKHVPSWGQSASDGFIQNSRPMGWLYDESEKNAASILQGFTTETSAEFSVVLPKSKAWVFQVEGGSSQITQVETLARPYSEYAVYKFSAVNLKINQVYRLSIRAEGETALFDQREFLALDRSKRTVRLGFLSCALDLLHRDDIYQKLEEQKPELFFFLGDNVYADRTSYFNKTPANATQLWNRYVQTRQRVAYYFMKRLIPTLAIWDDHDYGADNQGREFIHKESAKETFKIFFAQSTNPSAGPGIAQKFSAFGADFFLLDNRYFRETPRLLGSSLLGPAQEDWLINNLTGQTTWLLNGSINFGAYTGRESFERDYPDKFKALLRYLKKQDALMAFAGGDVHFSEINRIEQSQLGYETFELVSSSIHSYTMPGHQNRFNNRRRLVATGRHNFLILDARFEEARFQGEVTAYSAERPQFILALDVRR